MLGQGYTTIYSLYEIYQRKAEISHIAPTVRIVKIAQDVRRISEMDENRTGTGF